MKINTISVNLDTVKFLLGNTFSKKDLFQIVERHDAFSKAILRNIIVSAKITMPVYFEKELQTYKTVVISFDNIPFETQLENIPITSDCFELDDYHNLSETKDFWEKTCIALEDKRQQFISAKNAFDRVNLKKEFLQMLPESWLVTRVVTMTYENLLGICSCGQRRFHKLNEWSGKDDPTKENFISWARTLPYAQELLFSDELKNSNQ